MQTTKGETITNMFRQFKIKKSSLMSAMAPNVVGVSRSETINRRYCCGSTPLKNKERRTVSHRGYKISILTDVNFRETVSVQALAVLVRLICRRETMDTPITTCSSFLHLFSASNCPGISPKTLTDYRGILHKGLSIGC
jgi:hypothetical protein